MPRPKHGYVAHNLSLQALAVLLVSHLVGVFASENGNLYICDTTKLSNENKCYFVCSSNTYDASTCTVCPCSTIGAIQHSIDRTVAADFFRRINNNSGTQLTVSPKPWTQGDVLAASSSKISGAEWQYVLAFELVAPIRDYVMYSPTTVTSSQTEWDKWTKAFKDCSIKLTSHYDGNIKVYSTDELYPILQSTTTDNHHSSLQWLEEGAIDLVCAMAGLEMDDRCPTIQSANGIEQGEYSDCWVAAYTAIYGYPSYDVTLTSNSSDSTDYAFIFMMLFIICCCLTIIPLLGCVTFPFALVFFFLFVAYEVA